MVRIVILPLLNDGSDYSLIPQVNTNAHYFQFKALMMCLEDRMYFLMPKWSLIENCKSELILES